MGRARMNLSPGLAAGKVHQGLSEAVREFMTDRNRFFLSPEEIKTEVTHLARFGYENDPTNITAKFLLR